jgi:hypothetical protein
MVKSINVDQHRVARHSWAYFYIEEIIYNINIYYPYVISEPDLFPRCSPVSIPSVPAPPPKPTPFGPYIVKLLS